MLSEENEKARKIVFTGLDNGGKSSIILALRREIARIATLTPTKMVERTTFNFLDYKIVKHDLGGQRKYLINYLKQPGKYFDDTAACVYVIDIRDVARFKDTLSYFKDVLEQFENLELDPVIYVFFHKAEHILLEGDAGDETTLEGDGMHRVEVLKKEITEINDNRFKLNFRITTIFDLWSITSAFSDLMLDLYPQSVLLDKTLQEFGVKQGYDAILLLDPNSLTLAHYYRNDEAREILQSSTPYFLTLLDSWKPFGNKVDKKMMKVLLNNYVFLFTEVKDARIPLYFLVMSENPIDNSPLDELSASISQLIK